MKSGSSNFTDPKHEEDLFKREMSSIESMPPSRLGSVDVEPSRRNFGSTSPVTEPNDNSIADDNALEALLTNCINNDKNNESNEIRSAVAVAVAV